MRDIHTERSKAGPIPLISPLLHCTAMTGLVFLRRNFGYAFLRPKAIFFAFTWAFARLSSLMAPACRGATVAFN